MNIEVMVASAGLIGLGVAGLTGALWDSWLVRAPFSGGRSERSTGRHAR
ncbi:hypothetical protein [Mycolicibacterium sp. XJ1819]